MINEYDDPNATIINIQQHNVRICNSGAILIMEHPLCCKIEGNGNCRDNILNYMIKEGYLDQVDQIIVIDSYVKLI